MTWDTEAFSPEFKVFYEAFAFDTYGKSMGRAADHAMYVYETFSDEEKWLATEWFLELFSHGEHVFGYQYFHVVEKMNDKRFLPLLKAYYDRLKARQKRPVITELNGETVTVRPCFKKELQFCKNVMRALKRS